MAVIRWGVLGAAKIATKKVIPAMQRSASCQIAAIASRDIGRAQQAAQELGIAKAYGSYEALLADPDIDAIYNPLPNHLHVPWSIKAAEAGKHVLCEKPIALTADEARTLIAARDRTGVKIGEAFMVRTHPLWLRVRQLVLSGSIGELGTVNSVFSYFNNDPNNIRNQAEIGGGGLMDIGCYPITMSRFLYEREPMRVVGALQLDPQFGTDRLASAILDFGTGHAVFTCSTQLAPSQRMQIIGSKGVIEIEIPYNLPPDAPTRILLNSQEEAFPVLDQYTIQGELFSQSILQDTEVPVTLENALSNMQVIDAIFRSARSDRWEIVA